MSGSKRLILALIIGTAAVSVVWSQDEGLPKIPQRVYFADIEGAGGAANPALAMIPDYLYTAISSRQPIVRVDDAQQADSIVRTTVASGGAPATVTLIRGGSTVTEIAFSGGDNDALAAFVERAAAQFAPRLGLVEPKVEQADRQTESNAALIERVRLANQFARPFELSVTAAGVGRFLTDASGAAGIHFDAMPVVVDAVWFPGQTLGFVGSLYTYYGNGFTFGDTASGNGTASATSFFLLPGVGVRYRSLGTIFAEFSALFYAGYLHVTNTSGEAIGSNNNQQFTQFLAAGASTSTYYTTLRLVSAVGYAVTPHVLADASVSLYLDPLVFSSSFVKSSANVFIQYLSVGVTYRP